MSLIGAPQFRARLRAIQSTGRVTAREWADEDVRRIKREIVRRTGKTAGSVRVASVTDDGARVVGSPVVNFLASGTKAHDQAARNAQAMRFEIGGRTIFSKKVHHPATRGNPKIREAARLALTGFADICGRLWNDAA